MLKGAVDARTLSGLNKNWSSWKGNPLKNLSIIGLRKSLDLKVAADWESTQKEVS